MKYLLSLLLFFTPFAFGDMDKICSIELANDSLIAEDPELWKTSESQIKKQGCVRNNVLYLSVVSYDYYVAVTEWCRFDRQILVKPKYTKDADVICVMYDVKPREDLYWTSDANT